MCENGCFITVCDNGCIITVCDDGHIRKPDRQQVVTPACRLASGDYTRGSKSTTTTKLPDKGK